MKTPKGRYRIFRLTSAYSSNNIDEIFDLMENFYRKSLSEPGIPPAVVFDTKTGKLMEKPLINLTEMKKNG